MAVTVAGLWEKKWMSHERTERWIWRQTMFAYDVDRWVMATGRPGEFKSPEQFAHIDDMFEALDAPRTFVIAPKTRQGIPLDAYTHPTNATYVFGNTHDDTVRFIRPQDEIVSIYTPTDTVLFAHAVVGTVLYDRQRKL